MHPQKFTPYEKGVVAVLAFIQFTVILDFMILSPLGAILMPTLGISASQFGLVVSVYALSAGASGLLAAGFADRFDRKKLLVFFYSGFVLGTLLCGMATSYPLLLAARMVTGIFGGVIGSVVFAITTDLFPLQMRGRVMGIIQTAFASSQVFGLPLGLFLATHWGWHFPFWFIAAISAVVGLWFARYLKPINAHLQLHPDRHPMHHLVHTLSRPFYQVVYVMTALLTMGGFLLMPFGSAYTVNNLKVSLQDLPIVYVATGLCSMAAGPVIGRLCDSVGKFSVFMVATFWCMFMVTLYTHLGPTPLWLLVLVNTLLFLGISSRIISSSALVSAVPTPMDRGAFMAINASLQQIAGGIASGVAGLIVVQDASGRLEHYDRLGFLVMVAMAITIGMLFYVNRVLVQRAEREGQAVRREGSPEPFPSRKLGG